MKIIYCCKNCGGLISIKTALYGQGSCKQCYIMNMKKNSIQPKCIDCGKLLNNYYAKRCHSCHTKMMWKNKELISYGNRRKEKFIASFNHIYRNFKDLAKKRNHQNTLSIDDFKNIITKNCYYCNQEPQQFYPSHDKYCNGTMKFNGIDRKNSNIGYTKDNSVPCCKWCNWAKNSLSIKDFLNHVSKIYNFSVKNEKTT